MARCTRWVKFNMLMSNMCIALVTNSTNIAYSKASSQYVNLRAIALTKANFGISWTKLVNCVIMEHLMNICYYILRWMITRVLDAFMLIMFLMILPKVALIDCLNMSHMDVFNTWWDWCYLFLTKLLLVSGIMYILILPLYTLITHHYTDEEMKYIIRVK